MPADGSYLPRHTNTTQTRKYDPGTKIRPRHANVTQARKQERAMKGAARRGCDASLSCLETALMAAAPAADFGGGDGSPPPDSLLLSSPALHALHPRRLRGGGGLGLGGLGLGGGGGSPGPGPAVRNEAEAAVVPWGALCGAGRLHKRSSRRGGWIEEGGRK